MAGALRLAVQPRRLHLAAPLVTARGPITERSIWLVRVVTPAEPALAGFGEAAPLPGHGGGDPEGVMDAIGALATALRGFDLDFSGGYTADADTPRSLPSVAEALAGWREAALAVAPDAPAARAAVELALCDLGAQSVGLPLAEWLRRGAARRVAVNGVIGAGPAGAAAERARELAAAGFGTVKLKVGTDLAEDLQRVGAVRAAIGPRLRLRLDANGAWTADEALEALEALGEFDIELVEQPVPADDVAGLARVRAAAPIPVAADEALLVPGGAEAVLRAGAADLLVLKPGLIGGPLAALALAERAAVAGLRAFVTTALDSAVGRAGALHVAAALQGIDVGDGPDQHPGPSADSPGTTDPDSQRAVGAGLTWRPKKLPAGLAHGLATGSLLADDVAHGPAPHDGQMSIGPEPGLGIGFIDGAWHDPVGGFALGARP